MKPRLNQWNGNVVSILPREMESWKHICMNVPSIDMESSYIRKLSGAWEANGVRERIRFKEAKEGYQISDKRDICI